MVGDRAQQEWLCQFWVWPLTALLPDAVWWEEARPQKRGHTQVLWLQLSSQPKPAFKPAVWVAIMDIQSVCAPADMTTERSQGKKITQLRSVIHPNCEILIVRLLFQLWNKIFILWEDKKKLKQKFSLPFGLPSPYILHCVSFPNSRNTCSTIRSNIPLASTRQFLKDAIPSSSHKGSHGA